MNLMANLLITQLPSYRNHIEAKSTITCMSFDVNLMAGQMVDDQAFLIYGNHNQQSQLLGPFRQTRKVFPSCVERPVEL